ncbi:hypothetical protein HY78_18910 [Rhizorhabdus wittichii DC-6]|nr:hypothetical protein HY78_18910 [Rhizorhabdus wittichii DC-6]
MGLPIEKLPDWPDGLDHDEALAFTGVAETELKAWVRLRKVRTSTRGPNGRRLYYRPDLKAALEEMFTAGSDEDMDFG